MTRGVGIYVRRPIIHTGLDTRGAGNKLVRLSWVEQAEMRVNTLGATARNNANITKSNTAANRHHEIAFPRPSGPVRPTAYTPYQRLAPRRNRTIKKVICAICNIRSSFQFTRDRKDLNNQ